MVELLRVDVCGEIVSAKARKGKQTSELKSSPNKLKDRTFRVVFELPSVKREYKTLKPKPLRLYHNPIALAQEWQATLTNGDCSSPADLARKLGVSRTRVTQVLRLLKLTPEVLKTLANLGDHLASPVVTEWRLRPIVSLPVNEQEERIYAILRSSRTQQT